MLLSLETLRGIEAVVDTLRERVVVADGAPRVLTSLDKGLRIDAFLLSQPLAEDLIECGIDRSFRKGPRPSDHAPLLCVLRR